MGSLGIVPDMSERRFRICPICEAACNLEVKLEGEHIIATTGDAADTFSCGHVCPKGLALPELHDDPARIRAPLVKRGGAHVAVSWDEAYAAIAAGLGGVRERHGNAALAVYMGNPTVHNFGLTLGFSEVVKALSPGQFYSAGSIDQLPKNLASMLMFGNGNAVPVPDIERTDCLVVIGANPIVSNGSLWIVPGFRRKLAALKARGGQMVVVDPRRSETAGVADLHLAVRPGTDAWLLAGLCARLIERGRRPELPARGIELLTDALATIRSAETRCGLSAGTIDALADRLMAARRPAVYGRVGTTLTRFGTLTSFLIECVNVLTGSLDRAGGALFPEQAYVAPPRRRVAQTFGRFTSRVRGYPEVMGELPVAGLAEEIETEGTGQIRGLVTIAGNPAVSTPDSDGMARALGQLEFMVSADIYLNETTRHADVILPGTSPFNDSHYDQFLGSMGYRNNARYSPPVLPLRDRPDEWRMMLGLAVAIREGRPGAPEELDAFEDEVVVAAIARHVGGDGVLRGRDPHEIFQAIGPARGMERLLDLGVRAGPWGDGFGSREGITLEDMATSPHGIDQGPLRPRLAEVVFNEDGEINLGPDAIIQDIERLRQEGTSDGLLLIGRRNIQTNNSWLHNLPALGAGPRRAILEMHVAAANARGIADGEEVCVASGAAEVRATVRLHAEGDPDTVVLPHGFSELSDASQPEQRRGPNSNRLAPADHIDGLSGTAALNAIPVEVTRLG